MDAVWDDYDEDRRRARAVPRDRECDTGCGRHAVLVDAVQDLGFCLAHEGHWWAMMDWTYAEPAR